MLSGGLKEESGTKWAQHEVLPAEASLRDVLKKRYSKNLKQIYRRTHVSKCDFNKVALQLYWNHISA